jgi:pilus assembly protein Flp/PilA
VFQGREALHIWSLNPAKRQVSSPIADRHSKERRKAMLFAPKEKGQGLVEYALILVLVAIVVIAVLMLLGPIIGNVFSTINDSLSGV